MALGSRGTHIQLSHIIRTLESPLRVSLQPCMSCTSPYLRPHQTKRTFVTTPSSRHAEREYFAPPKDTEKIRITRPAWHHPVYTEEQMNAISVAHRETDRWSDKVAMMMVRLLRFGMDTATG